MKTIKIIKFDDYRYRIQTHNDGIYDMSEPMEIGAILRTLQRSLDDLYDKIEYWKRIVFNIGHEGKKFYKVESFQETTLIPLQKHYVELQAAYNQFYKSTLDCSIQEVTNEKK